MNHMLIQMTGVVRSITAKTHWSTRQLEGYDVELDVEWPDPNDETKPERRNLRFPLPVTIAPPLAGSIMTVQIFQVDADIEVPDDEDSDDNDDSIQGDPHYDEIKQGG